MDRDDRESLGVCQAHEGRPAIAKCARCGRYLCPLCVSRGAEVSGQLVCAECTGLLFASRGLRREVPWESRGNASRLRAFFATWREIIFAPRRFFGSLDPNGGVFMPLVFSGLCLGIGLLGSLWGVAETANALLGPTGGMVAAGVAVALAPISYIISFAATVGFLHLLARGFGGRAGLRATTRVTAYAQAAAVAEVIPAIGSILSLVLRLSLYGWGISAVHGLSTKKALVIYFVILTTAVGFLYFATRLVTPFLPLAA